MMCLINCSKLNNIYWLLAVFTPLWIAEEVVGAIPNNELHINEGCGHAFHWEKIEDFNLRVRNWLMSL